MAFLSFTFFGLFGPAAPRVQAQSDAVGEGEHEREELGVNRYTIPRIDRLLEQLDKLRPLPFDQLWRPLPNSGPKPRELKGLVFGGLIADGFLIVAARKQSTVDEFGRVLLREARGLGVAKQVTRHSASLSELGKAGKWDAVRDELSATQKDVEAAMIALRDAKLAALISLGGWLRGLEISSAALEQNFSPQRAKVLQQAELVQYFIEELDTLPPQVAHTAVFDRLRDGVKTIGSIIGNDEAVPLDSAKVEKLHAKARDLDLLLLQNE